MRSLVKENKHADNCSNWFLVCVQEYQRAELDVPQCFLFAVFCKIGALERNAY